MAASPGTLFWFKQQNDIKNTKGEQPVRCPWCYLNLLNCRTPFKFRTLPYPLYIWTLSLFSLRICQLDFSQVEVLDAACFAHSLLHIRICLGHLTCLKVPHVCWYWVLGKGGLHRSIIRLSPEAGINKISQRSSYLWPHVLRVSLSLRMTSCHKK